MIFLFTLNMLARSSPSRLCPSVIALRYTKNEYSGSFLIELIIINSIHAQSASRMYDPLSSSIVRPNAKQQSSSSTSVKTGMSVMQLQELITPSKQLQAKSRSSGTCSSFSGSSPRSSAPPSSVLSDRMRSIELETEQLDAKRKALADLVREQLICFKFA